MIIIILFESRIFGGMKIEITSQILIFMKIKLQDKKINNMGLIS